jgi:4-aminobutyrate aminotransferase/(S)-3-amino-2-methylpropionate transaminase
VPSFREPFAAQLGNHVRFVSYPRSEGALDSTLAAVAALLAGGEIGAILVEPILGRGGVVVPPPGFVAELARLARAHGALLVADEIWTGMGRGGSLVHSLAGGVVPDLLCLGKGLGASFPISACLGTGRAMSAWARGGSVVHTSTHAGAPFACAAALATIDAVRSQDLGARAAAVGRRFQDALRSALAGDSRVREVRGAGLLVGMEMASGREGIAVLRSLLGRGYVATAGGFDGAVVVFTPPLTIDEPVLLDSAAVVAACVGALP